MPLELLEPLDHCPLKNKLIIVCNPQRCIQIAIKHLRWNFLQNQFTALKKKRKSNSIKIKAIFAFAG